MISNLRDEMSCCSLSEEYQNLRFRIEELTTEKIRLQKVRSSLHSALFLTYLDI